MQTRFINAPLCSSSVLYHVGAGFWREWPIFFKQFSIGCCLHFAKKRKSPEYECFFQGTLGNFSGLFRALPQFPLYLCNAEVLSHQTSQSSLFFLHWKHVKRLAFESKRIAVWQLAFRVWKVLGTFEKQALEHKCYLSVKINSVS